MVKDLSDSESGKPQPQLHELLIPISNKGSFICTHTEDRTYHSLFVTPVVEH